MERSGESARLVDHLPYQGVDQRGLDAEADPPGRGLDGPSQLVGRHGADQDQVGGEQVGQVRIEGAVAGEIGPDR